MPRVFLCAAYALSALTLAACGSDDAGSCAPGGTYLPTLTRSADPGDCPAALDDLVTSKTLVVGDNQACGSRSIAFDEDDIDLGADCMTNGTEVLVGSASGVSGTVTIETNCPSGGGAVCTARYDLVFTREAP